MGIARKLKEVDQAMKPMATQMDLRVFLSNPENVQRLDVLVEDI